MSRSERGGFTFVELLIVIAIIVTLIGFMLPAVRRVQVTAWRRAPASARGGPTTVRGVDPAAGVPTAWHLGGVNVARADATVSFVHDSIAPEVWGAAVTIAGGGPPVSLVD